MCGDKCGYQCECEGMETITWAKIWSNGSHGRTDRLDTYCCSSSTCESKNGKVVCPTGQSKIVNITQKCDFTNDCPKVKEYVIALSSFCKSDQECYEGYSFAPNICKPRPK